MPPIRLIVCTAALLASVTAAHAASAGDDRHTRGVEIGSKGDDGPERIGPRHAATSAKSQLLATNGWSEMMLKNDDVVLQLTDYGMQQVTAPQDDEDKDEGFLGSILKAMTLSGVKQLLNHSIVLGLKDTRSAAVRDGEIIVVTCGGKEVFNHVKINNSVQKYPREQAEAFVQTINQARAKYPACPT